MRGMLVRAIRAARLDRAGYREAIDDPETILNAAGIVILTGIAIGLGLTEVFQADPNSTTGTDLLMERLLGVWLAVVTMMVGWILWAAVALALGKVFLHGGASFRQILRAVGVCYGPGTLFVFVPIPFVGGPAVIIAWAWVVVSGVAAVHEAQDVDWFGAGVAGFAGWAIGFVLPSWLLLAG